MILSKMTLSLRPPNTPKYNCWHLFSIVMHIRSMETTKYLAVKSSIKGTCCTPIWSIWSILRRSIKLKSLYLSALKLKMKSRCILSLTIQNELWWFRKPHQTTHLLNHVKDTWKERERENSEWCSRQEAVQQSELAALHASPNKHGYHL